MNEVKAFQEALMMRRVASRFKAAFEAKAAEKSTLGGISTETVVEASEAAPPRK